MADSVQKVLFVNSEIFPYLPESDIANIGRYLPQGIQELKKEIRSFMPRFGCINERKNQLHEVIRLSGMNVIIGDIDRPLIIKVASISAARIQVYFIDNEDYFRRKQTYCAEDGTFFADNSERTIFFARGVLETVKKLRWAPDVIHCQGWLSHLVPVYLKKAYRHDPIFSNCKIVLSLYESDLQTSFHKDFATNALYGEVGDKDLDLLKTSDGTGLAKTAVRFSDAVILGSENLPVQLVNYCRDRGLPVLKYKAKSITEGSYIEEYNEFFDKL